MRTSTRKLGFAVTCLILVALVFTASGPFAAQAQSDDPLYGYGVLESSVQNYGDGGWGGWSVPAGKVVTGGGFWLTGGPVAASAPATPNSTWPHHNYGEGEYGWVVQDALDGSGSSGSYVYAIYADEPAGYEIVTSSPMSFSSGGWGGWSCPEGKVVLGGGFEADGPVAVSAPGVPGTEYPHYTYGPDEYGWVVQNANEPNTITIFAICADQPAGYEIVESAELNYGDGGWAGWSCPNGKAVTGGGFWLTGGPAAVSAPGTPGSVWPHYTYGQEYGWVVQDAPDGSSSPGSHVYAICASAVIYVDEANCDPVDEQGTSEKPFCSIQTAIDNAVDGDTIQVAAGTYQEDLTIPNSLDHITLLGANAGVSAGVEPGARGDESVIEGSIDVGGTQGCVGTTIDGFEIKSGSFSGVAMRGQTVTVKNSIVEGDGDNSASGLSFDGTGHAMTSAGFSFEGNQIAGYKFGIRVDGDASEFDASGTPSKIVANYLTNNERAVQTYGSMHGGTVIHEIENNTIEGNERGIRLSGGQFSITGNTISNNVQYGIDVGASEYSLSGLDISENAIHGNDKGLIVGAGDDVEQIAINWNTISGNTTSGVLNETTDGLDATYNWWGAASGPSGEGPGTGDAVSENVDYSPWWGDDEGSFDVEEGDDGEIVVPSGTDASEIQQIIDDAPYGTVIVLPPGTIQGSFTITNPGITIVLSDGTVIQPTSPCFVVEADDTTITSESLGGVCQPSGGDPGMDVSIAVSGLVIKGIEIDGSGTTGDGILIDVAVTNVQILDNHIHSCASGIRYTSNGVVSGVHEVQGNLFMGNDDYGVQNQSGELYDVTYNSWGAQDGPDDGTDGSGDSVSANLDFDPWTHVDVFMASSGSPKQDQVRVGYQITYTIQMDAYEVQGADFQLSFDNSALEVVSITDGELFALQGSVSGVTEANTDGVIAFRGSREGAALSGTEQEVYTVVFQALSAGSSPVALELSEASFAMAPGYGGSNNIYASELEDGEVTIHPATTVTGRIDLQGRADNSGAVMTFLEGFTLGYGPFEFDASSYWGDISVDGVAYEDTYTITVDKYRYLNVTADSGKSVTVDTDPQELATLVLFGGDANSDDEIDIADATIIGGAYGTVPGEGDWDERADINGDGVIDILDLALMGGNFGKTSDSAYDGWMP